MRNYLDELLDYYDINRTDKEGIWVKTDKGAIVPFNFDNKKEDNMKERIKVDFYEREDNLYEWTLEILDNEYDYSKLGYKIFHISGYDYILVALDDNNRNNTKIYSTTDRIYYYDTLEIKEIVEEINRGYYYIDISDKVSIAIDYDRDLDIDRNRKRLNNYFNNYKEAQDKYDKIINILGVDNENSR